MAANVRLESLYQHTSFTRGESRRDFGVKKGVLDSFVGNWMVNRTSNIHPIHWMWPPPSNSGKWRFSSESPTKNVAILVVTGILVGGNTQPIHPKTDGWFAPETVPTGCKLESTNFYSCLLSWDLTFLFVKIILGGGFKEFLFSPLFGEDSHFD